MKYFIMILSIFIGCSGSLDDGKPPVVTKLSDGSFHIDRLDPGESVTIPIFVTGKNEDSE